jgi:hypothetical protein
MLIMRLTVPPSASTRRLAFRPAGNWLRKHYWYVTAAALVLLILNELSLYGTHLRRWDWLFVTGWVTFLVAFRATFLLPDKVDEVLTRLAASQVLSGGMGELDSFRREMHISARRSARTGGLIVAVVIALGWIVAYRTALASHFLTLIVEVAGAFLAGSFIGRAVSYSQLGQRLQRQKFTIKVNPEHLDGVAGLRPVGRLYFFQSALVAVPGAFLAVWWFVIPLLGGRYSVWRGVYAGLLVFVVACEFFAFLAPMWSFHRIMSKGKEEFLDEADHISDQAAQIQNELLDSGSESDIAQLEDKLGRLTKRYQAIVQMPTWPVDTTIRRRFAVNNLLLLVPVVAQVLGAPGSVQNLLDNVQKVFTGQS